MDKAILIADSGSTKTSWCLVRGSRQRHLKTQGISPYFLKKDQIVTLLEDELLPQLEGSSQDVQQLYFYGTGLGVPEQAQLMKEVLTRIFPESKVTVNHDLTGAAHALCQHKQGLACILGTGSGACCYDGQKIVKSSPGLGFILGDEGSGAYLGKMLVQRYLYKTLDRELMDAFEKKYRLSKAEILKKVYQEPFPNRYLASFARFLGENRGNDAAEAIIERGIKDFLLIHVKSYEESQRLPVHFVGGIADAFQDVVSRLVVHHGLHLGRILSRPLEGLVQYHLE